MIKQQANALPSLDFLVEPPKSTPILPKLNNTTKKLKQTKLWPSHNFLKAPAQQKAVSNLPPADRTPSGLFCRLPNGHCFNMSVKFSMPKKKPIQKAAKKLVRKQQKGHDEEVNEIVNGKHQSLLDKFLSYFRYVQEQKKMQTRKWQTQFVTEERKIICQESAEAQKELKWWKSNEKLKMMSRKVEAIGSQLIFLK